MKKLLIVTILIGLMLPVLLLADPGHGPEKPPKINLIQKLHRVADELGLTAEQIDRIKAEHFATEKKVILIRADLELARLELRQLLEADAPNESEVFRQIDEVGKHQTALKKARMGEKLKIRSILTADQWEQWEDLKADRMKERGERFREQKREFRAQ